MDDEDEEPPPTLRFKLRDFFQVKEDIDPGGAGSVCQVRIKEE